MQKASSASAMSTSQLDNVREGASTMKVNMAGTDGGWIHPKPLQTRFATPTGIMTFDGESAWNQYDPHILVPKEWGKQGELWENSLRDWPDPSDGMWQTGQQPTWKDINYRRWPLHRIPKCAPRLQYSSPHGASHTLPAPYPNFPQPARRTTRGTHACAPWSCSCGMHPSSSCIIFSCMLLCPRNTGTIAPALRSTCELAS